MPIPTFSKVAQALNTLGLDSKFNSPTGLETQVLRRELCDAIARANGQLVLVSAPAGFGKTTSMTQARDALEEAGVPTVWLTLDRADNDLSRFLASLKEVVARLDLVPGSSSDAVAALTEARASYALFLDDLESVHEAAVLGLIREIAFRLPRGAYLVIGSRASPQIGLARLRVRGLLVEIDAARLRFKLEETRIFFARQPQSQSLTADQVFQLHQKTEGWVAALWLASMALERGGDKGEFVERFSGSDRAIADYLAEDVLGHQPMPIRRFLLRTSLLRQLDASVCSVLNPSLDCAEVLERLDTEHVFLTPVAADRPTWRYHSLFADYLRTQLQRQYPDDVARLHLAASGWYESQRRPVPAIDHAIEGGDYTHAMKLLQNHAADFLAGGRMRLLARWIASLPSADLERRPVLEMVAVWAICFTRGAWEAMARLERAGLEGQSDPLLSAHANGVRPLLLAMQDRNEEALEAGREALKKLPTGYDFPDTTLLNAMADLASVAGQPEEAQQLLDAARRRHTGSAIFNRMYTESNEGQLDLLQGRLRLASARFRLAVDATHAVNFHHTHGNAWAGVFYTSVVYESNLLDQADHLLNVYLPLATEVGLPDHMIQCHTMRARIAFINGDVDSASLALTELEYLGGSRKLPRVVAAAKLERARLLLLQGHGSAAHDELIRADDPIVWGREREQRLMAHDTHYMGLARLRWEIHFGDAVATLPGLAAEIQRAKSAGRIRRMLVLQLLQALAMHRTGDQAGAVARMAPVMQFSSQEGFMRLVLDEGSAMGALVQRYWTQHDALASPDPLLSDYLLRLLKAFGPMASEASAQPGDTASEPLTSKELKALELLAEGYSNSAMAEKLFVSESTVRTHLRKINAKLGARSRTQAVAIARRLGVLK